VKPSARGSGVAVDPSRIREARAAAGLSLAQLAGDKVSRTFIHLVEHGRARPSPKVLELIARRTGRPIDYFLSAAAPQAQFEDDLATELMHVANHVKRLVTATRLSRLEREAMTMIEVSLHQGAALTRLIQSKRRR